MRRVMGRFVTGVAVILCDAPGGPTGLTVNSLTSLSLDPPLILFCARNDSKAATRIIHQGTFSVNILCTDQRPISIHFAGRRDLPVKLDVERNSDHTWLRGSNGVLCCRVSNTYPGGDHRIIIGEVQTVLVAARRAPALLYVDGAYESLPEATGLGAL